MQKRQTPRQGLFLIEMVIVILFFAVTAAICMRLFVGASYTSRAASDLSQAVLLAQTQAETIKSEGRTQPDAYQMWYDADGQLSDEMTATYHLKVEGAAQEDMLLWDIAVYRGTNILYTLRVEQYVGGIVHA